MSENCPPSKKVVIVVHGMGKRKKSSFLLDVANPILRWLQHTGKIEVHVEPNLKTNDQMQEPSEVLLSTEEQSWLFTEAYWSDSFIAPAFDPMVGWVFWRFLLHIGSLLYTTFLYTLIPALFGILLSISLIYTLFLTGLMTLYVIIAYLLLFPILWFGFIFRAIVKLSIKEASPFIVLKLFPTPKKILAQRNKFIDLLKKNLPFLLKIIPPDYNPYSITPAIDKIASNLKKWGSDELALVELIRDTSRFDEQVIYGLILLLALLFHALTAIALVFLYTLGLILFSVIMTVIWLLSLVSAIPGIPGLINIIKKPLDVLLVGSLGDIRVFLDDPIQAQLIRNPLEQLLNRFNEDSDCESIHIIAHSTGAAIAYETLALKYNQVITSKIKTFFTLGSILQMVWKRPHRPSFDQPLRSDLKWFNLWTKYDPALSGPTPSQKRSENFVERQVSNDDNLLSDHTAYWSNYRQVISFIVSQIWDTSKSNTPFYQTRGQQNMDTKIRKQYLLWLTIPRLMAWYSPLIFFFRDDWAINFIEFIRQEIVLPTFMLELICNHLGGTDLFDRLIIFTLAGGTILVLSLLLHKLYKDLIWDFFISKRGLNL